MDQAAPRPLASFPDRTFGRLPYDAWHECIRFAAMQSVAGPPPYLAVSPCWAESIISSPRLWDTITFDDGEDQEARLHAFSHLSQGLPLYLVYHSSSSSNAMGHFIHKHRRRIQSIEDPHRDPYLSVILGTITTSLPALRYLESHSDYISQGFLLHCVNLRILEGPKMRIVDEACLGPHVESVCFKDVEPSEIANVTHRMNIRQLELDLRRDGHHLWDEKPSDSFGTHMTNIFTKIGHTLSDLTLYMSFHSYSALILLVSSIPGLHTLSLNLTITKDLEDLPQLSPPQIRHSDIQTVRVLSIGLKRRFPDSISDPRPADALMHSLAVEHPLRELITFEFICWTACHEDYMGPLLQSAVNAHSIRVSTESSIPTSLRMDRQLMPRLRSLNLPSLRLYNCIDAPNLRELILASDRDGDKVPLEIDAVTDLQKLTVPGAIMDYVGISDQSSWNCKSIEFFPKCPQDITPFSRLESVKCSGGGVNQFLLKILENPNVCPRLHIIATRECPLWELLFEVLRKRNSSSVRRITQITLSRLPVLQLLWRLVRLLSGETAVFTNRNVDDIIARRLLCPQILCCFRCTRAEYASCINHPQSLRYGEIDSSDFQNLLDLDYPVDKEPITAHDLWDRWRNFQSRNSFQNRRADNGHFYQCHAYYPDCPVGITEHTLDGISIPLPVKDSI